MSNTIQRALPPPPLRQLPTPVKALFTAILLMTSIGMVGAGGQILVHDIIPTFFTVKKAEQDENANVLPSTTSKTAVNRDLFGELDLPHQKAAEIALYEQEQFVWLLQWTHIHLFGMNMIFIFVGMVTIFLDIPTNRRTWLVVLPFAGVLVDIAAMWLKSYVSGIFFWLHLPGGGLFGAVFAYVAARALWEMWIVKNEGRQAFGGK